MVPNEAVIYPEYLAKLTQVLLTYRLGINYGTKQIYLKQKR